MNPSAIRFWSQVTRGPGCWLWNGQPGSHGYGQVTFEGRSTVAHRVAWELAHGLVPDGLFVLHECDVRLCVRPDHLFLGTHQDNMDDMVRKGRARRGRLSAEDVEAIRAAKDVSQRELAKRFRVSQRTIWNVLRGRVHRDR